MTALAGPGRESRPPGAAAAPAAGRAPLRILLAEDNPVNQRLAVGAAGEARAQRSSWPATAARRSTALDARSASTPC